MKKDLVVDMWKGDKFEPKKFKADMYFVEVETYHGYYYTGNIYNNDGKIIGDYLSNDSVVVENNFILN